MSEKRRRRKGAADDSEGSDLSETEPDSKPSAPTDNKTTVSDFII